MQGIDLKKGWNISKAATLGLAVAALTACGGGGGSDGAVGSTGSNPLGTPISQAEFAQGVARSGVWRADMEGNFIIDHDFGGGVVGTSDAEFEGKLIHSWEVLSGTVVAEDDCSLDGAQIYDIANEDYEDLFDEDQLGSCNVSTSFFQSDDSTYAIEATCGSNSIQVVLESLTSVPEFDNGSITFTLDTYDNLAINSGVCGSTLYIEDNFTSSTIGNQVFYGSIITVVAPYSGSKIQLEIDLNEEIDVGTFSINNADLWISSDQFGSTGIETLSATSGTITISSVSTYAVSGTYDVILEDGNTLVGNFSLNLD